MNNILLLTAILTCGTTAPLFAQQTREAARKPAVVERLDKNDDGKVGPCERRAGREDVRKHVVDNWSDEWQSFAKEHPQVAEKLRAEADLDGDGSVDAAEREAAHQRMREFRQDRRSERREDRQQRADVHPETAKKIEQRADRNDDGKVGPRERRHARRVVHERRQQQRDS